MANASWRWPAAAPAPVSRRPARPRARGPPGPRPLRPVRLAGRSLLDGECEMARAGGVAVHLPQRTGYVYEEGGISSPDGHCRSFDAEARGTVGGDGAAAVLLKPLEAALADGDQIHAAIPRTPPPTAGAGQG